MTSELANYLSYLASIFVAAGFCMKTIIPLRFLAICSNICFILYSVLVTPLIWPFFALHCFLLPLNIIRLKQAKKMIKDIQDMSQGSYPFDVLIPYMSKEVFQKGDIIFKKNDTADKLYLITSGLVEIPETNHIVEPREVFGEMSILGSSKKRTASAICLEKTDVLTIDQDKVIMLCYQNPKFSFYLTQLAVNRLIANQEALS